MMVKVIIYKSLFTIDDVKNNDDCLWLYGDNDIKKGKGGQAIIRDEPNTCGIPTKKFPNNFEKSFYTDKEYDDNCKKISLAFKKVRIILKLKSYKSIVIPIAGFGTGLAKLEIKAPKTFLFLNNELKKLVTELNNQEKEIKQEKEINDINIV